MKSHTKDEKFLIALYEIDLENANSEGHFDKYEVGRRAGLNPKAVDAIANLLIKANFIKKRDEAHISLTSHGANLAQNLLNE